jgi:hypothetical protein
LRGGIVKAPLKDRLEAAIHAGDVAAIDDHDCILLYSARQKTAFFDKSPAGAAIVNAEGVASLHHFFL